MDMRTFTFLVDISISHPPSHADSTNSPDEVAPEATSSSTDTPPEQQEQSEPPLLAPPDESTEDTEDDVLPIGNDTEDGQEDQVDIGTIRLLTQSLADRMVRIILGRLTDADDDLDEQEADSRIRLRRVPPPGFSLADILRKSMTYHSEGQWSSSECAICLDKFAFYSRVFTTPCRHSFHPECIYEVVMHNMTSCPICRSSLADAHS